MKLRLKSKYGSAICSLDTEQTSIGRLIDEIKNRYEDLLNKDPSAKIVELKRGFPPQSIDISNLQVLLKEANIQHGDQIMVEVNGKELDSSKQEQKPSELTEIPSTYVSQLNKYLILRNIPDDNSCLFNSISYTLYGSEAIRPGSLSSQRLRDIVIEEIGAHPEIYSEVVLGRTNEKYREWIRRSTSWGGAIELGILAERLQVCIQCLDIELGQFIKFESEMRKPRSFIILIYLGIHYDVLALNDTLSKNTDSVSSDSCVWPLDSKISLALKDAALELCALLQSRNYSTNTTTFRVRCLVCYQVLVGETGATRHANETGHFNFGEVK